VAQRVFISYAWEDDKAFVERLHRDLTRNGFEVWRDRTSLAWDHRPFRQEIGDAIRSHDRLILVVGPKAAASPSVRQEWQWALALDKPVIPILRQGDYNLLPGELSALQCDDFRADTQYRAQLARLIRSLRRPEPRLGTMFGVPSLPPHFLARPDLLRQVKDILLADLKAPVVITAADARIGVYGMGGIGKSVLAAALAHDREVRRSYPHGIIWLTIGQKPDLATLQRNVARHLGYRKHIHADTDVQSVLKHLLQRKAALLILDDVWNAGDTQAFDVLGPRCRALVTTRDAGILHTLGGPSVHVELLTEQEALRLLSESVGVESSALPPQALEIVKECGSLPLAVALCGGMVKQHGGDWSGVLNRLKNADIDRIVDPNAIEERHRSIWRAMHVSVNALSKKKRQRFAELAVFARDNPVPEAAVATLWSYTANLSTLDTTDLLVNLADGSLIRLDQKAPTPGEPIERRFSLHDLLYDYAARLAGERQAQNAGLLAAYRKRCNHGWSSGPDDGYFYQHLAHHLQRAGKQRELEKLLFDYRWLRSKLRATDANGLIADFDLLPDDSQARLVQGAIRMSSHWLAQDRSHLPSQLTGRLISQKGARISRLLTGLARHEEGAWLRPLTATLTPPGGPSLRTLRGHAHVVTAVAVTPDGHLAVSASYDKTLKVWDLAAGKDRQTLRGHKDAVTAVAVTPDGRSAVSASDDKTLKVWDLAAGKARQTLRGHKDAVMAVAVTPDGRSAVSASYDGTLKVWDLATGKARQTLRGHHGSVDAVAVTPDGRSVVSASGGGLLEVWDLAAGKALRTLRGHKDMVKAVAVTPDGRSAVSASYDKTLKVWDLATGKARQTLRGHVNTVAAVAVTPDGRSAVSASDDWTLKVWDLATGKDLQTLRGHESAVTAVAVTPDGRSAVSGSYDRMLKVWDLAAGKNLQTLPGHEAEVRAVAATPDGRSAVSGSFDKTLKVWDLAAGKARRTLRGHEHVVMAVAVTPDGRSAVSGSYDKTLRLWDLAAGKARRTLRGRVGRVTAVAVTPDGRSAVSASEDGTLKVWDLAAGKARRTLRGHVDWVAAVTVTPDGRYAVSGSNDLTLKVWDLATGEDLQTLGGHWGTVRAVAVTPDGRHAVSASYDKTLKVWDLAAGEALQTLRGHVGWVTAVAVTPDGRHAVSGSDDHTLRVWDLETGNLVASFGADGAILACAAAPDGVTIVAGDVLGQVHFLRLENVKQGRRGQGDK
jgi:WD40 repeat protein